MKELIKYNDKIKYSNKKNLYKVVKRTFDISFSVIAFLILLPFLLIIAILVFYEDGKPVIFKQKRVGINGSLFTIYKFRSMKVSNNKSRKSCIYNWKNGVPNNFVFKDTKVDEKNVTRVGKFIRRYSIDELPQLINVIKGEMSIVGPRPEIPEIVSCYNFVQKQRLLVKPGMTGYAQVHGRSNITHGEQMEYDIYYVINQCVKMDVIIICKTCFQVLIGKDSV